MDSFAFKPQNAVNNLITYRVKLPDSRRDFYVLDQWGSSLTCKRNWNIATVWKSGSKMDPLYGS